MKEWLDCCMDVCSFYKYGSEKFDNPFFSHLFTRLRLGFSCPREYLFKTNHIALPFCKCSLDSELVKHFFLVCPGYAAHRNVLFTSAATCTILGEMWSSNFDARKIDFLVYGVKSVDDDINCTLHVFCEVQHFIIERLRARTSPWFFFFF